MSDRLALLQAALSNTLWQDMDWAPLPVDASARRYFRLTRPTGESVIVMDAPPEAGEDLPRFIRIAEHLLGLGLCPPKILFQDIALGLLVIEDLGADQFAQWALHNPKDETTLYLAATETIAKYAQAAAPTGLATLTPGVAAEMIDLYPQWVTGADAGGGADLTKTMFAAYDRFVSPDRSLSLRDFHAENLIWRPNRSGTDRVGLLDFQDAFLAPRLYDLVSLLRDPRRQVSPETVAACKTHFLNLTGIPDTQMDAEFACVAAQRNLRILAVFHRLIKRDDKQKYANFLPRVADYLAQDLSHPALDDIRKAVRKCGGLSV